MDSTLTSIQAGTLNSMSREDSCWRSLATNPTSMWIAGALHAAYGLVLAVLLYHDLRMYTLDIGIFDQIVWNTAAGRWFQYSLSPLHNFMAGHFSPILALFAALHYVIPSPHCLLLAQQLGFSLTGAAVGRIVSRRTGSVAWGWACALLIWCHPSSLGISYSDFHVITLAFPATVALFWFGRQGHVVGTILAGAVLLSVREDAGFAMAAVGSILFFERGRRRLGVVLALIGCSWIVLTGWVVMPVLRDWYAMPGNTHQGELGRMRSPAALGGMWPFVSQIVLGSKQWMYVAQLLFACGFLPLLTGRRCIGILVAASYIFLFPPCLSLVKHYATIPFAITTCLLLITFCDIIPAVSNNRRRRVISTWIVLALLVSVPLSLWRDGRQRMWILRPTDRHTHFENVRAYLRDDARVAASLTVGPHIAHRRQLYYWPEEVLKETRQSTSVLNSADYIFCDYRREAAANRRHRTTALEKDPQWQLVHRSGDFALFERIAIPANADGADIACGEP